MKLSSLLVAGLAVTAVAVALPRPAQAAFPEKAVTIIVPFGVGGNFDTLARKLAQRWEKELKVPFVIKSLPGSGGRRGSIRIAKSKPDGYTIGFVHYVPFLADIYLRGKKPAVDYKKFKIIYKISHSPNYLFVRKSGPYMSMKDLANAGKTIKFASTGIGAITWVEANATAALVGFPLNFVLGYKKLTNAAIAVAKGDADMRRVKHLASLYLYPDVSRFGLAQYDRAREIAQAGYEGSIEAIRAWWREKTSV